MLRKLKELFLKLFNKNKIKPSQKTNLKLFDDKILRRSLYFYNLFKAIENIEGNIIECGVGEGITLSIMCLLSLLDKKNRLVWGFDSFEGFPKFTDEDSLVNESSMDEYKMFDIKYVYKTLNEFGISKSDIDRKIILAKGFIPESLSLYDGSPIALLHLDLDLYLSYKNSINYFYDKVNLGGIIAFDEYNKPMDVEKWPGAAKAINEFLELKGLKNNIIKDYISGNVFMIKE